jgi:hypothetical protein
VKSVFLEKVGPEGLECEESKARASFSPAAASATAARKDFSSPDSTPAGSAYMIYLYDASVAARAVRQSSEV